MRWIKRSYSRGGGFLDAVVETLTEVTENMEPGQGYTWWTARRPWPPTNVPRSEDEGGHWTDLI